MDSFLGKQDLDRIHRLGEDIHELDKPRRESASQIDEFFEPIPIPQPLRQSQQSPGMNSYVSMRSLTTTGDDDVFLRPPLWEDIASSIQNIDPENANMLGTLSGGLNGQATHVKLEVTDELVAACAPSPLLSPLEIKTEKVKKPFPPLVNQIFKNFFYFRFFSNRIQISIY